MPAITAATLDIGANGQWKAAQGTITADKPALNTSATWNSSGVTFTHLKANVTDTASAAASLLIDLQVGGVSQFKVTKAGAATLVGGITATTASFTTINASGAVVFSSSLSVAQITNRTASGSPVHNLRMAKAGASGTDADLGEYAGATTALADDTATHIAITGARGLLFVWVYNEAGTNAQASIFSFISGTRADQLTTGGNATIGNEGVTTLAGTTGTDVRFNLGFAGNAVYFENRLGYTVRFAWKIIRV